MDVREKLIDYYSNTSKHSNYQVLASSLKSVLGSDDVQTRTRSEQERLEYILRNIDVAGKTVLDIGGNTGFFTFELIDAGARSAHLYEGNKEHVEFVTLAAEVLGLSDKVRVTNDYFNFEEPYDERYDVVLLLNVLHHLGDDYGDKTATINEAKAGMIQQLNSMSQLTRTLVFQLGFNWQGDPKVGLFENGTKQEMIDFIKEGIAGYWDIEYIGVPVRTENGITYNNLNDQNILRDDSLGEFLNRPLFILKSTQNDG